ncbi:hypothetical protein GCM10023093_19080 [Nemorincola caseinilytica]|uniref:Secretion system C-terminal sorting domain-containing protein n=2 Tax=Nemorincola caseinilytica TaxID=2054315 RepID=A0ABP8NID1_9BACT
MATDADGNVYVAMWSSFDSIGSAAFTSHSSIYQTQVILTKYDNAGNVIWSRSSTSGNTMPMDITVDANSNVFLYGYFSGDEVKFGAQTIVRTAAMGSNTTYVIKYDKEGTFQWKVNAGTVSLNTEKQSAGSIAADDQGNVYAAATYYSTVKIGTYTLANSGSEDISVAKYSPAGALIWAKRFGGIGYDRVSSITVNKNNKILLAGEFSSPSMAFGSTSLSFSASCASSGYSCFNIYIAQLGTDGSVAWARQSQGNSRVMSIVTDSLNDIYIGGSLLDDMVSFGGHSIADGHNDPFLAKYSSTGDVIRVIPFTQTMPVERPHAIWDVAIDACNNVWVSGGMDTLFGNGVYVDTSIILPVPQTGIDPLYIVSYTPSGLLNDYAVLSSGGLSNSGLAADRQGTIFLCGYYNAATTMYMGADSLAAVADVYRNFFVGRYRPLRSCIANSVTSFAGTETLDVYPNPTSGNIYLSAAAPIGNVTITDMLGRTVLTATYAATAASIQVDNLAPGMYLLRTGNGQVHKLVKE